jgi:nucleotide-binding universal stress UspA family protein
MFKRILIVVDRQAVAGAAISEGLSMARSHGAEVVFLCVLPRYAVPVADMPPPPTISPQEFMKEAKSTADVLLADAAESAEKAGVTSRSAVGSGEDEARCIAQEAQASRCELIVVASEGRNALLRLLTGSVVPGLVTSSPMPVLVRNGASARLLASGDDPPRGPRRPTDAIRRILILLEDRGPAQSAVVEGLALARAHNAEVLFVHVSPVGLGPSVDVLSIASDSGERLLREIEQASQRLLASAKGAARRNGTGARGMSLPSGLGGSDLATLAVEQECDLIVVATEGRNAVMRLLSGSVIPGLITAATVPVLICRDQESRPVRSLPRRRRHRHKAAAAAANSIHGRSP